MSRVFGLAVTALGFYTGMVWLQRAGMGLMIAGAYNDQRAAKRKARDAYNASLKDRLQMVDLQADAPRTLALGRVRTVEGVRRRWVSGTNSEKLTLIVSFAGHEIDGYEAFYFDDNLLTLDGSGWVTTDRYRKQTLVSALEAAPPTGASTVVTLPHTPVAGSVSAVLQYREVSEPTRESPGTVSVAGNVVTVTGYDTGLLAGGAGVAEVIVSYQHNTGGPMARIRPYTGTAGQNVGADLAAEYPGKITATDRFAGIALAVVDLIYDPDVYPQGIPNVTAVLRGAKVLDPRTSTTAWSENPALLAYHYARWAQGWALQTGHIVTADINAAADVCDASTSFALRDAAGALSSVTLPRYRCGIVISSAADPRSSMDDILEAMAGRSGWAGGTWRLRAGTCAAPVATLSQAWLAVPQDDAGAPGASAIRITNGMPREAKLNTVGGRFVDPDQRHQVLPFPAVRDEVLIAAHGEYPGELDLAGVNHLAHAQHLASIRIRESMAGLRLELGAGVQAYPVELFDVLTLDLPRYGVPAAFGKRAEVIGWSWHPSTGIGLQLAEIAADIFTPLAELTGRDPAPNSAFPNPAEIEQLTITGVSSALVEDTDTAIVTRTRVQWSAAAAKSIQSGGNIELQYSLVEGSHASDWASRQEAGGATEATLVGLLSGRSYLFRVRAVKPWMGAAGPWSRQVAHRVADLPAVSGDAGLRLQSTSQTFAFDGANIAAPTTQSITFTPSAVGVTWEAKRYDIAGALIDDITASLGGGGLTRALSVSTFGAAAYCVVRITQGADSDQVTVHRLRDGASAIAGYLTNEAHAVATAADGSGGDFTGAGGTFRVFRGLTDVTTSGTVTYSVVGSSGAVGASISAAGVYAITGMSADVATVQLRAVVAGVTIDKVFTATRSKAGLAGLNVLRVMIYQRSTTGAPSVPSGVVTVDFAAGGTVTGLNNGWSSTIPAGTGPLYVAAATAASTTSSDNIFPLEWSSPVILAQDGSSGLNAATVYLYQRSNSTSAPAVPAGSLTYTFATGVLSGTLGAWSQSVPPAGSGKYLYVTTAAAVSSSATDTILTSEWSSVQRLAADGDTGATGRRGPVRVAWAVASQSTLWSYGGAGSGGPADTAAAAAIAAATGGDFPWYYDECTLYVAGTPWSETRYIYPSPGVGWTPISGYLSGDALVADAITQAASGFTAGPVTLSNIA